MVKIAIAGVCGRMGRRILNLACQDDEIEVTGVYESKGHKCVGEECENLKVESGVEAVVKDCDVIIDFTTREALAENLGSAKKARKALIIGTTGLSSEDMKSIEKAAAEIPIVQAPNMSIGVNLLFKIANMTAKALSDEYDVEIVEAHHKHKKDAPSGTAIELARQICDARHVSFDKEVTYGRQGMVGERKKGEVGIHAVRGGDVVGEHTVSFITNGERIELVHKASSRDAFAKGALKAAKFVASKKNGLYNMQSVLGI